MVVNLVLRDGWFQFMEELISKVEEPPSPKREPNRFFISVRAPSPFLPGLLNRIKK